MLGPANSNSYKLIAKFLHMTHDTYVVKACARFVLMTRKWITTKWHFHHVGNVNKITWWNDHRDIKATKSEESRPTVVRQKCKPYNIISLANLMTIGMCCILIVDKMICDDGNCFCSGTKTSVSPDINLGNKRGREKERERKRERERDHSTRATITLFSDISTGLAQYDVMGHYLLSSVSLIAIHVWKCLEVAYLTE